MARTGILMALGEGLSSYGKILGEQRKGRQSLQMEQLKHERAVSLENLRATNVAKGREQQFELAQKGQVAQEKRAVTAREAEREAGLAFTLEHQAEVATGAAEAQVAAAEITTKAQLDAKEAQFESYAQRTGLTEGTPEYDQAYGKMVHGDPGIDKDFNLKIWQEAQNFFTDTYGDNPKALKKAKAELKAQGYGDKDGIVTNDIVLGSISNMIKSDITGKPSVTGAPTGPPTQEAIVQRVAQEIASNPAEEAQIKAEAETKFPGITAKLEEAILAGEQVGAPGVPRIRAGQRGILSRARDIYTGQPPKRVRREEDYGIGA